MELVPRDKERGLQTPIWNRYESLLLKADCKVSAAPVTGPSVSWGLRKKEPWTWRWQKTHPFSLRSHWQA